jgi:foldase protein PrsA
MGNNIYIVLFMNLKTRLNKAKKDYLGYKKDLIKNPKKKRTLIFGLIAIIILVLLYANIGLLLAAMVNGQPVTRLQLVKELEKQGGKQVLESIITEKLIYQEAKKNNIIITQQDLDSELASIDEQLKLQGTDLDTALAFQGQTRDDLTKDLKIKLTVEKLISDKINITDAEINSYFETNKNTFEEKATLESVKDQIINALEQQKLSEIYQQWIQELKSKSTIKYLVAY